MQTRKENHKEMIISMMKPIEAMKNFVKQLFGKINFFKGGETKKIVEESKKSIEEIKADHTPFAPSRRYPGLDNAWMRGGYSRSFRKEQLIGKLLHISSNEKYESSRCRRYKVKEFRVVEKVGHLKYRLEPI